MKPDDVLATLKAGNERFVKGMPQCGPYGPRVADFANDPYPFAVVLGCSDARVPVETVFDQVPGNLFVIRVAGNYINDDNAASVEFGVETLKASLVLVLGHSRCGAIRAAMATMRDGKQQPGHIQKIVERILPAIRHSKTVLGDSQETAVRLNVAYNVEAIARGSEIVSRAVTEGRLHVSGAIYNVATGFVDFLDVRMTPRLA